MSQPAPKTRTVQLVPSGKTIRAVELAPGQLRALDLPPVQTYGILQFVPDPSGEKYIPRLRTWGPQVDLREDVLKSLGLGDISVRQVRRLAHAGFVRIAEVTPRKQLLDIQSLVDFITDTQTGEYWTPERRRAYSLACAAII